MLLSRRAFLARFGAPTAATAAMSALPEVLIEGQGAQTIVMIHGWPDTYRLWDEQAAYFSRQYRVIRFTLPGFDIDKPRVILTAVELTEVFRRIIEHVSPGQPVTLMLHDWGCVFGYEFYNRHPLLVSRIVGVDIGNPRSLGAALSFSQKLFVLGYQVILALLWKIGGRLGDVLSRKFAKVLGARSEPARIHAGMGYPYWNTWFGRGNPDNKIQQFKPECPMLFIYGRRKPAMFHTPDWLAWLKAKRPENRVVEFDTGHWVMRQQPDRFNEVVSNWLGGKV